MNNGRFIIDQTTHSIRMDRRIKATPEWLFNAWVDPAQLRLWWDPTGKPLDICEVDLRVGGALRLVNSDHPDHAFAGVYSRIDPPHRLEFDAMGAQGSVTFKAAGELTEMVLEIRCASAEHLAMFMRMGVADGTAQTVDNLVARAEHSFAA